VTPFAQHFIFAVLATVAVLSGLAVVTTRNVVHAAFWLVPTFAAISGIYLTLSSQLMFGVQLLIYVGAITVLILFALMLTQGDSQGEPAEQSHNTLVGWAGLVSLVFAALMFLMIKKQPWWTTPRSAPGYEVPAVGTALFGEYVLVLEGAAILLLAATIAAITLARKEADQ